MFILDTDTYIEISRGRDCVQKRMAQAGISNCLISEISLAELYVGFYKRKNPLEPLFTFLEKNITTVPISSAIKTYARIRTELESIGMRLEDNDLFIAATALVNNYTLVSHNTKHFSRIPGLKLEDWTQE